MNCMTVSMVKDFEAALRNNERSKATLEKYHRDLMAFFSFLSSDNPGGTNTDTVTVKDESDLKREGFTFQG